MTAKEYATTLKGKSMYKEYELTDREYFVLIVIDALRICTAEVVACRYRNHYPRVLPHDPKRPSSRSG